VRGRPRRIAVGCNANLCAFAPDTFVADPGSLHRHLVTPYAGRLLAGVVRTT
jgi:allantoinase